ncbi:MAG: DEAD/DEAH box helicase, partial [Smithellaceae bacterium]|nr:DEAD/DEAH box helicase [Smithellaceae bacterium]
MKLFENKAHRILEKIEAPLLFSSRESYLHLPTIKEMGVAMITLADEFERTVLGCSIQEEDRQGLSTRLLQFRGLFAAFDSLTIDEKKKAITTAQALLIEIRDILPDAATLTPCEGTIPANATDNLDESFHKLSLPLQYVKGVGPKTAALLSKKLLNNIEDALYFLPRRYEDRRHIDAVKDLKVNVTGTVIGTVCKAEIHPYARRRVFEVVLDDGSGTITAKWFRGNFRFLRGTFGKGQRLILTGDVQGVHGHWEMIHPDFEIIDSDEDDFLHFMRIVPIYSETEGLRQKNIRRIMKRIVTDYASALASPIPEEIAKRRDLLDIHTAINEVHFPSTDQNIELYNEGRSLAHRRVIYDELFFFQLGLAAKRAGSNLEPGIIFREGSRLLSEFYRCLPFTPTAAQLRVTNEIHASMARGAPMHRLLQGDVGSGKTIVAMAAMIRACENGYQAVLMAPTEILAAQQISRISEWCNHLGLKAAM